MKIFYLLIFSTILFSCKSTEEGETAFERVWFYDDNLSAEKQRENISKYGGNSEYSFSAASFLNLQPEGKFTSYFTAFDYGNWKLQQDSTLVLTSHNKGKLLLEVKMLNPSK